jgi:uncharacterized membrane protein YhdT
MTSCSSFRFEPARSKILASMVWDVASRKINTWCRCEYLEGVSAGDSRDLPAWSDRSCELVQLPGGDRGQYGVDGPD